MAIRSPKRVDERRVMKAAVLKQLGQPLKIEERPRPAVGAEEALVQVMACGTDGTDLKIVDGFGYRPELPAILGHEVAGVVSSVGGRVTQVKPGDRVVVYNFTTCGRCRMCLTHREQLCLNMMGVLGAKNRGGHAEYLAIPARQLVSLPENIAWTEAAVLADARITALHAVDRAGVGLSDRMVIFGVGGVGISAIQISKLAGASVMAVDRTREKVKIAYEMGADFAIDSTGSDIQEAIREFTQGLGADGVIDCVGVEQTMGAAMDGLRPGGRLTIVGYTPETYGLNGKRLAQNELEVIGARCGRLQDLVDVVQLMAEGKLKPIVTHVYPLEAINQAMTDLRSGKVLGRAVLLMPAGRKALGHSANPTGAP